MKGQITELHSDAFFAVSGGEVYRLSARGRLKKTTSVLVGDYVEFSDGAIEKVYQRENRFIRPSVANADLIVAVVSPVPEPDFLMLDKLAASAVKENVPVIFAVNKTDLGGGLYEKVKAEYSAVGEIYAVSAAEKSGLNELKAALKGKLSVLAGQSAVGKSSLVNALFGTDIRTGDVSEIGRGRHTTTASRIYEAAGIRLTDTPGFAVLEADIPAEDLRFCYPEFNAVLNSCKFADCKHVGEPSCRVAELAAEGKIPLGRYERYKQIYAELKAKRRLYE